MNPSLSYTLLFCLVSVCFTLATFIQPRTDAWSTRAHAGLLSTVFGEGRRLFANHFFVQADIYFHSGYYPSIFDQPAKPLNNAHLTGDSLPGATDSHTDAGDTAAHAADDHGEDHETEHYRQMAMDQPRDCFEAFGRRFVVTTHKHLSGGNEREMLPWLKLSADMDPQKIDTYTVAAYWLRNMGKTREAEEFLRLGLRQNPDSYEILFELARLVEFSHNDDERAANLLGMALHKWQRTEAGKPEPHYVMLDKILVHLAQVEEKLGRKRQAIEHLKQALPISPSPESIQRLIKRLET